MKKNNDFDNELIDEEDDFNEDEEWDRTVSRWYPNSSPEEIEDELMDRFCKD